MTTAARMGRFHGRRSIPAALALLLALSAGCGQTPAQRGLYYWGAEVNVLCPCGGEDCFWVRADTEVLGRLRTFVEQQTDKPYQPVFLSYRGQRLDEPGAGFAAEYEGYLAIAEVVSISVSLPADCPPP